MDVISTFAFMEPGYELWTALPANNRILRSGTTPLILNNDVMALMSSECKVNDKFVHFLSILQQTAGTAGGARHSAFLGRRGLRGLGGGFGKYEPLLTAVASK